MKYYVNKNDTENPGKHHEVHNEDCYLLKVIEEKIYLGEFPSCKEAVERAKLYYSDADGCIHCCPACHKG